MCLQAVEASVDNITPSSHIFVVCEILVITNIYGNKLAFHQLCSSQLFYDDVSIKNKRSLNSDL